MLLPQSRSRQGWTGQAQGRGHQPRAEFIVPVLGRDPLRLSGVAALCAVALTPSARAAAHLVRPRPQG